jgi:hypothetical protein
MFLGFLQSVTSRDSLQPASVGFLPGLLVDPEDEAGKLLRKFGPLGTTYRSS